MKYKHILFFIFVFFQLFGIKISGVIDLTLLASLAMALLFGCHRMSRLQFFIILCCSIFYSYTILLGAAAHNISLYLFARYLRMFFSLCLLALIIHSSNIEFRIIIKMISVLILIHAFTILFQMGFPVLKEYMAPIVGYYKDVGQYRAFGLHGSYDMAAIYLCIGMILYFYQYMIERKTVFLVNLNILWVAGLCTGRFFMVIGSLVLLLMVLLLCLIKHSKMIIKPSIITLGIIEGICFFHFIGLFLFASLGFQVENKDAIADKFTGNTGGGYYIGSLNVIKKTAYLPPEAKNLFWGGLDDPRSDNGYVRIFHTHGLFGMLWLFLCYFIIVFKIWKHRYRQKKKHWAYERWVTLSVFLLILIFNIKMIMFGSRGITELFFLFSFSIYAAQRRETLEYRLHSQHT